MAHHAKVARTQRLATTTNRPPLTMDLVSCWTATGIVEELRSLMPVAFVVALVQFMSVVVKTSQWEIAIAMATSWTLVVFAEEMARLALVAPMRRLATMTKRRPLTTVHV